MRQFIWILLALFSSCSGTEPSTTSTTMGDGENQLSDGSAAVGLVLPSQHELEFVSLCVDHIGFKAQDGVVRNIHFPLPIEIVLNEEMLSNRIALIANLSMRRQINLSVLQQMYLGINPLCASSANSIEVKALGIEESYKSQAAWDLPFSEIVQRGGESERSVKAQTHMYFDVSQLLNGIGRSIQLGFDPNDVMEKFDGTLFWNWY